MNEDFWSRKFHSGENRKLRETFSHLKEDLFPKQADSWVRSACDRFGKGFPMWTSFIVALLVFGIFSMMFGSAYRAATGRSFWEGSPGILTFLAFIIAVIVFILLYSWMKNQLVNSEGPDGRRVSKRGTFGKAHFAGEAEIAEICEITDPKEAEGVIIGQIEGKAVWFPEYKMIRGDKRKTLINDNIFILGNPGSGKSFTVIKPYIIQTIKKGDSFITHDPSGEAYRDTSPLAKTNGYKVVVINTMNPGASDGWDIVGEVSKSVNDRPEECTERATNLADSIWANTQDEFAKPNPFWDDQGKNLLTWALLYVGLNPYFKGKRDIGSLIDVIGKVNEKSDDGKRYLWDDKMDALARASMGEDPCLAAYGAFANAGLQRGQVPSGLAVRLSRIAINANVREMLSSDDIDLLTVSKEKTAIYLITDETSKAFDFIASAFITSLISATTEVWRSNGEKLDIPVHFILDELIALGHIPNYARIFANTRKYQMPQIIVVQDIQLFETEYKDSWQSLVSSCALTLFLAASQTDQKTCEYMSKILGTQTIISETLRRTGFAVEQFSFDFTPQEMSSENKRPLMNPEEVGQLEGNILIAIAKPSEDISINLRLEKFPVTLHPAWGFCERNKESPVDHIPERGAFKSEYYEKLKESIKAKKKAKGEGAEEAVKTEGQAAVSAFEDLDDDNDPFGENTAGYSGGGFTGGRTRNDFFEVPEEKKAAEKKPVDDGYLDGFAEAFAESKNSSRGQLDREEEEPKKDGTSEKPQGEKEFFDELSNLLDGEGEGEEDEVERARREIEELNSLSEMEEATEDESAYTEDDGYSTAAATALNIEVNEEDW